MRFGLALAGALILAPGALRSQENKEPSNPEVVNLTLHGVNVVREDELRNSIHTTASHCNSWILKPFCWISKAKYFYTKKYLDREELKRDPLRIQVFYWKRGYRETTVDTAVVDRGTNKVGVTFTINEGPPTMVTSVIVNQATELLTPKEIQRRVVIGANGPLNLIRIDTTRLLLTQSLWDKGYADAEVDTSVVVDSASRTAVVEFTLNPRWLTTVEDIVVDGNSGVSDSTVMRSLTLKVGDIFRRSELLRSQRKLYESNMFRRAAIEPRPPLDISTPDSAKIIVVTVQESPLREARLSAGFSTLDFVQLQGRFAHYNFMGGARRLEVQGAVGNLFAHSLSGRGIFRDVTEVRTSERARYFAPTYNASIDLRQPWFWSPLNELALSFFSHRRSAPGIYVDRGYGTSFTFTREVTERAPVSANYRFEMSKVDAGDVYFCLNYGVCEQATLEALRGNQRLSPFALTGSIDRTNDPFSPNRGYRGNAGVEHASSFTLSDFRYHRATADVANFFQVRKRGVIAAHARVGWVRSLGSTQQATGIVPDLGNAILHPRKRFYAGGSHSVRGFGENQLGPRVLTVSIDVLQKNDSLNVACTSGADVTACNPNAPGMADRDFDPRPLGGTFLVEGSVEARFPVWRELIGAAFIDGGLVQRRRIGELPTRRSAITPGFGVRYKSPVGPIRADIGFNPGTTESLPVVTENVVNGQTTLVTLQQPRVYSPARGILRRMVLHLSIGEAF